MTVLQESEMTLSVRLAPEEEALLEAASRQTARSKSQLARQAIQEFCARLQRQEQSAFDLGADLFGQGALEIAGRDAFKTALGEKLRAKHRRLD
jgi:predicted transcriptional regulator